MNMKQKALLDQKNALNKSALFAEHKDDKIEKTSLFRLLKT